MGSIQLFPILILIWVAGYKRSPDKLSCLLAQKVLDCQDQKSKDAGPRQNAAWDILIKFYILHYIYIFFNPEQ